MDIVFKLTILIYFNLKKYLYTFTVPFHFRKNSEENPNKRNPSDVYHLRFNRIHITKLLAQSHILAVIYSEEMKK